MERKCDHPVVVKMSNGRATCPDNLYIRFKMKDNCNNCFKAKSAKSEGTKPVSVGEETANIILRIQRETNFQS